MDTKFNNDGGYHGRCKFFDPGKGWGIITGDDGIEYFIHVTNLLDRIRAGDDVKFNLGESYSRENEFQAVEVIINKYKHNEDKNGNIRGEYY